MAIKDKTEVGKKGEILPKKPLREISGIKPGDSVMIEANPGELIIRKIFSVKEAMSMPVISKGSPEDIEKELEREGKIQEEQSANE
ncbi:MAG: AbrB/MazE/SpoVT family DNA-binding domain-containing protein [Candidatus Hodarchaeota archaeon]